MSKLSILILFFLMVLLVIPFVPNFVFGGIINSTTGQFNITPDEISLNYSNNYLQNITIGNNVSNQIQLNVSNTSTTIVGNYSQSQSLSKCNIVEVLVQNEWGSLRIQNITNTTENASINVEINNPISMNNTLNSTGYGTFGGSLPANANAYQYYFFNTSEVKDSTSVMVELTSATNIDLLLYDESNNLKAKSVNKTSTKSLVYNYLPKNETWKIVLYGNTTSTTYGGTIVFSGLNATNTSNTAQQASLDFGVSNITSSPYQRNITMKNEVNFTLSNVVESKELYHVDWFSSSGKNNFTFLVPDYASNIRVYLNWTGGSNYTTNLYYPNGSLADTQTPDYNASVIGLEQIIYVNKSDIQEGFWKVGVINNTNVTNAYYVESRVYMDETNWISTNYTAFTFNRTGEVNSNTTFQVNFTVTNTSMNGLYEGYLRYTASSGSILEIPISVNVTVAEFSQEGNLQTSSSQINENIGANLTRTMNITFNNTGVHSLTLDSSLNSTFLNTSSGEYIEFTYTPINSIPAADSAQLNITLTINTTKTNDATDEVYVGWIYLNATNTPSSSSGYPYPYLNLTLRVNLTNYLIVDFLTPYIQTADNDPDDLANPGTENITIYLNVSHSNGTVIDELTKNNFTIWLEEKNTGILIGSSTSSLTRYNGTNPIFCPSGCDYNNRYAINFTIPSNKAGGNYTVRVRADYNRSDGYSFTASNNKDSILVNNTGVALSPNATSLSVYECGSTGSIGYIDISAINYGAKTATGSLVFSNASCTYVEITAYSNNCSGTTTAGDTFSNIGLEGNATEGCSFIWKAQSHSTNLTENKVCSSLKVTSNEPSLRNVTGITITVIDRESETTTTTTTAATTTTDGGEGEGEAEAEGEGEEESVYLEIKTYPSTVSVEQGKNKTESVLVKNINDTVSQTVTLTVTGINSSWYDILISKKKIDPEKMYTYYVTFLIPNNATVKDYACKFKASSSYDTVSKSFTLEVAPGPELQEGINVTLSDYESRISTLETQINQSRDEGKNTTIAESKLSELKDMFKQALGYRDTGDYKSAYELFDDIDILLNETRTALEEAGLPSLGWWRWGKWVVVAVVGVVALFLGYLFWPTGGYEPGREFVLKTKKEIVKDELSEKYRKLKEKWSKIREKEEEKKKEQQVTTGESQ